MKVLIQNRQKTAKINQQKIKRDSSALLRLLGLAGTELSILLVNDKKMRQLNFTYRGIDKTTDVLSFPQFSWEAGKRGSADAKDFQTSELPNFQASALVLGDVVINLQAAKRQAPEHGLSFMEEIRWLLVHGILHLIGYDHEKSKYAGRKMREKEKELLKYMGSTGKDKS